jgi:hypothetical protein
MPHSVFYSFKSYCQCGYLKKFWSALKERDYTGHKTFIEKLTVAVRFVFVYLSCFLSSWNVSCMDMTGLEVVRLWFAGYCRWVHLKLDETRREVVRMQLLDWVKRRGERGTWYFRPPLNVSSCVFYRMFHNSKTWVEIWLLHKEFYPRHIRGRVNK